MRILNSQIWGKIAAPLGGLFGLGIKLRGVLYRKAVFPSYKLNTRVISVGNIVTGGTGKTPLVEYLANCLQKEKFNIAVLSRGYGKKKDGMVIVSDGNRIHVTPKEAGDEPYLLAKHLFGIPVIASPDRIEAGRFVLDKWKCDFLILDDAFQHRRLNRNFDLVVLDGINPWGNGKLLPAGPMREPISSLSRADYIFISRADQAGDIQKIKDRIRNVTQVPIISAIHEPLEWISIKETVTMDLKEFEEKPVLAFAGIGNPESFEMTLKELGVHCMDFIRFRDHEWYQPKSLHRLINKAEYMGVEILVTTEKDSIRIPQTWSGKYPIYYLKIGLRINSGDKEFEQFMNRMITS